MVVAILKKDLQNSGEFAAAAAKIVEFYRTLALSKAMNDSLLGYPDDLAIIMKSSRKNLKAFFCSGAPGILNNMTFHVFLRLSGGVFVGSIIS